VSLVLLYAILAVLIGIGLRILNSRETIFRTFPSEKEFDGIALAVFKPKTNKSEVV